MTKNISGQQPNIDKENITMKPETPKTYDLPPRLPDPLQDPKFDPKQVADRIERRRSELDLKNARRAGAQWAIDSATAAELAFLEEVAVGVAPYLAQDYESELRSTCTYQHAGPETYELHDVMKRVVDERNPSGKLLSAFRDGAVAVWRVVKTSVAELTSKTSETSTPN